MSEAHRHQPDNPEDNHQEQQSGRTDRHNPSFGVILKDIYLPDSVLPKLPEASKADLHICPDCTAERVYPLDWVDQVEKDGVTYNGSAYIYLYCPDCDWCGEGGYSKEVIDRFDEVLTNAKEDEEAALREAEWANMEEDVERFAEALRKGHIEPMDF